MRQVHSKTVSVLLAQHPHLEGVPPYFVGIVPVVRPTY